MVYRILSMTFLLVLFSISGCRDIPADRVYALKLAAAPTESDWESALPRQVIVRGGRKHAEDVLPDVNRDTVHTSTPSCHHGGSLPDPIAVDMRAFYTDSHLYLRLSWVDPTRDDTLYRWAFDGTRWHNEKGLEDGLGLAWADPKAFPDFSCAYACHIADFGVAGASFHADTRMRLAQEGSALDLWNWKADRTARLEFADDRWLDSEGMHGDEPGEIFHENSYAASLQGTQTLPFCEDDRPLFNGEGKPLGSGFLPPGMRIHGYLIEPPRGGRADVEAQTEHANGRWTVILRRKLNTGDPRDRLFRPGTATAFGLSVMDHTLSEHYASTLQEMLVLLPPEQKPESGATQ